MTKIRKAKETMSAKERVLRTFAFEKTDRVPIDYATNGSIHHRLCVELGIPGDNYDLLLEALGVLPRRSPRLYRPPALSSSSRPAGGPSLRLLYPLGGK